MRRTGAEIRTASAVDSSSARPKVRLLPLRRFAFVAWLWLAIFVLPGCAYLRETFRPRQTFAPNPPECTSEDLVRQINTEISRVNSWRSSDVSIRMSGVAIVTLRLTADLAVQSPRNLRLRVQSPGGVEADLGSNSERFWFWTRRANPPYVMTVRHEQAGLLQEKMQLPFEADWLMEAMGVVPLPEGRFTLQPATTGQNSNHYHLVSQEQAPNGQTLSRTVLVDPRTRRVAAHLLQDQAGVLIAKAAVSDYRLDRRTGISLPHRLDLEWPPTKIKMVLEIGAIELNPESYPEQMWKLPEIAGSPIVDLGQMHARQQAHEGAGRVQLRRGDLPGRGVDAAGRPENGNGFAPRGNNPFGPQGPSANAGPTGPVSRGFGEEPPWESEGAVPRTAEGPFDLRQ